MNAEIEQLKRIKEYTKLKNEKSNIIKYEPNSNQTSTTNKLDAQQKAAILSLAKNYLKEADLKYIEAFSL